jgi:hypothetical protein
LCLLTAWSTTVNAAEKVVIEGGNPDGGPFYGWRVTNRYSSPIVRVEFPQYGADLFTPPPQWETGTVKEMNLVNVGWNYKKPGLCYAVPEPSNPGIPLGGSADFSMRVAPTVATLPSKGIVHVEFADGTTCDVAGVELPTQVQKENPLGMLLGIGALFVLGVIILEIRKRRTAKTAANSPPADQP